MKYDFDVIIIGGGPAGSTLASYLAKDNISCAVFEKEKFPRPHVGESLVVSSTRIFQELDLIDKLEKAKFLKKYGAVWTTEKNANIHSHDWEDVEDAYKIGIHFKDNVPEGIHQNYTYHVDRAKFDKLLLDHSEEYGAVIFEEHQVLSTDISDEKAVLTVRDSSGCKHEFLSKIIVDASGRNTLIGSQNKWKIKDPVFDQFSMHSWFQNYTRSKIEEQNIAIHFLPIANSWIWQIPITETITSIGIVSQKENIKGTDKEKFFWETIKGRPEIYTKLKESEQLRPLTFEGDYSYTMKEITDNRLLLVGDAARFIDPIFSSGVSIAMQSSMFAARDIIKAVKADKFDKSQFENYETLIHRGCKNWYDFITLYYRLNVMFTYFLGKHEYRRDVLKFLQGDVYDEDNPKFLEVMRTFVKDVEENPKHPLHNYLHSLTGNRFSG